MGQLSPESVKTWTSEVYGGEQSTSIPKGSRMNLDRHTLAVAAIGAVLGSALTFGAQAVLDDSDSPASSSSPSGGVTEVEASEEEPLPTVQLTPDDFAVKLTVTQKQCYGSAGCNVTMRVDPSFTGISADGSWDVTYEISGDESGPQVQTFTMADGEISYTSEVDLSTPSSKTTPKAKITLVSPSP